jgi:hypothetical protein
LKGEVQGRVWGLELDDDDDDDTHSFVEFDLSFPFSHQNGGLSMSCEREYELGVLAHSRLRP